MNIYKLGTFPNDVTQIWLFLTPPPRGPPLPRPGFLNLGYLSSRGYAESSRGFRKGSMVCAKGNANYGMGGTQIKKIIGIIKQTDIDVMYNETIMICN